MTVDRGHSIIFVWIHVNIEEGLLKQADHILKSRYNILKTIYFSIYFILLVKHCGCWPIGFNETDIP